AGCSNQRIEQALTGSMNKIATLFHPKIYGGTMLLTLNSSIEYCLEKDSASVPVAAYEALAQSEDKLQSYKSSTAVRRKLFVRIH
ncbi:hypothetical protein, partial [Thiolapillus sp.]|uniref:hypothetical protein n=1 Tax=Thiolapillus sp. TaxID=2017437 RepID=UPI003AF60326